MTTKEVMGVTILLCILVSVIAFCNFIRLVLGAEWGWFMVFLIFTAIGVSISLEYRRLYGSRE